ncbi:MAG: porin family protein [Steroidobacteraceae bacterium]|nr:porin family protein [Steroidobacteraceae bacterium]
MNMKFAALASLGTLALITAAPNAKAADNGFYLGAGVTKTEFNIEDDGFGSDDIDDNSFKVIAGFRPLDWLAVEANYIDLGSSDEDGIELDTNAITLSGLALAEFGVVDVYARLGVARVTANLDIDDLGINESDEGWEPTYGIGVGVHFGSLGVRAEYERFNTELFDLAELDTDVDTLSLSFTYTFL